MRAAKKRKSATIPRTNAVLRSSFPAALRNISIVMNPLLDFLIEAVGIVRSADVRGENGKIKMRCEQFDQYDINLCTTFLRLASLVA